MRAAQVAAIAHARRPMGTGSLPAGASLQSVTGLADPCAEEVRRHRGVARIALELGREAPAPGPQASYRGAVAPVRERRPDPAPARALPVAAPRDHDHGAT